MSETVTGHSATDAPAIDELLAKARHQRQSFGRIITNETYRIDEGVLVVTKMHDHYHDMTLAMIVGHDTTVKQIAGSMERMPYAVCPHALESLQNLVGLQIFRRGVTTEIHKRIPRNLGCTHFDSMLQATLKALFTGASLHFGDPDKPKPDWTREEDRQFRIESPILRNTCRSFNSADEDKAIQEEARRKRDEARKDYLPKSPIDNMF